MNRKVPKELAQAQILDETGQPRTVGELWKDSPVVIMWVRHFGCIGCTAQVEEFKPEIQKLRDAKIHFTIIGSGAANFVQGFKERLELDVPVYSDEKRVTYTALKMRRGLLTMVDPRMLKNILLPFKYRQREIMGDPLQQGGVVVIRPEGRITYEYISKYNGDHPAPHAVVAAALQGRLNK